MNSVVIVAGGSGTRMDSEIPKQFMEINGKPVILWTIDKFISFDSTMRIVLVLPENHVLIWQSILDKHPLYQKVIITTGGVTRYHSVLKGLEHTQKKDLVGIHDAVRPLVSVDTIKRCYKMAAKKGSAIPVIEMEDSLRKRTGGGNEVLSRSQVKRVQTPQVFNAEKLITAYKNSLEENVTDDAAVFEAYYGSVQLVEGNRENIKITFPSDLKLAAALLK